MKTYEVEINGMTTTLRLSDADAQARGLKPVADKAKTPANKAKTPANKGRQPSDKRAEAAAQAFGAKSD
jgi:hypothetical protein